MRPYDYYTVNDLYSFLKTCTPEPDGSSKYSNLGAGFAGVLAERISGNTYWNLLTTYIFQPFGMSSHPDASIDSTENKAQGYFGKNKSIYWKADALAPAGTLKCSADEMLTYLQNMSSPRSEASGKIIDKLLERTAEVVPGMNVCRAWHTLENEVHPVIYWHDGGTYGFSTFAAFIRKKNKAVIVVVNEFDKNTVSETLGIAIMNRLIR